MASVSWGIGQGAREAWAFWTNFRTVTLGRKALILGVLLTGDPACWIVSLSSTTGHSGTLKSDSRSLVVKARWEIEPRWWPDGWGCISVPGRGAERREEGRDNSTDGNREQRRVPGCPPPSSQALSALPPLLRVDPELLCLACISRFSLFWTGFSIDGSLLTFFSFLIPSWTLCLSRFPFWTFDLLVQPPVFPICLSGQLRSSSSSLSSVSSSSHHLHQMSRTHHHHCCNSNDNNNNSNITTVIILLLTPTEQIQPLLLVLLWIISFNLHWESPVIDYSHVKSFTRGQAEWWSQDLNSVGSPRGPLNIQTSLKRQTRNVRTAQDVSVICFRWCGRAGDCWELVFSKSALVCLS